MECQKRELEYDIKEDKKKPPLLEISGGSWKIWIGYGNLKSK